MECSRVEELLSAYHDRELELETQKLVEEHISQCLTCAQRLRDLRNISLATRRLRESKPPENLRDRLEEQLDRDIAPKIVASSGHRKKISNSAAAVLSVAVMLMVVVTVWIVLGRGDSHRHAAADISHFLVEYRKHPEEAQHDLTAKYQGREVDLHEAAWEGHFQPVAAAELPGEIPLKNVYLLKMPCCLCVQSIYQRPDKGLIVMFEHEDEQPAWFGDRPCITTTCDGKPASIIQCDGELAVTWKKNKRFVTIVGARTLEEVGNFVAYLDDRRRD